MQEREKFQSRLGFILVSAGCAIGLGNVWKFPYICGENGGAAFIMIYLLFLTVLGWPILMAEFAVGRGSRRSIAQSFSMVRHCRKLSADDVLYHGNRLDDVLCVACRIRAA